MYLKSLDTSISDTKQPSHVDIITWVDQAYKMLKNCKVYSIKDTLHEYEFLKYIFVKWKFLIFQNLSLQEEIESGFVDTEVFPIL